VQIEMHALEKEKDDKASRQRLEEVKNELAVSFLFSVTNSFRGGRLAFRACRVDCLWG
jgi:hypothetical protein